MTEVINPSPPTTEARGSVVVGIPAYNEEKTIADIVTEALTYVDDVLVVDDGSADRTAEKAEEAGATVVRHDQNRGYGSALRTIFVEADSREFDKLVIIDADGQHDPSDIQKLVDAQRTTGAGVVIGSRFARDGGTDAPLYRRVGLTVVNTLTNLGLRLAFATPHITDTQSGFRVYDAAAIETISQTETLSEGMDASIDILFKTARDDHDIIEIPIDITYDVEDANTHHPVVQGLVLLVNILSRLYSVRPGLLLTTFATLCLVVGGGLALAVLSTSLLTRAALVLIATVCLFLSVILLRTVFGLDNQASE
jgi:hypothetical protein